MKWQTMIAVVGRGQADKVMAAAREAGAPGGTICNARGTASSSILAALGLGDTRKEVLFSVISRGDPDAILSAVHNVKAKGVVMMTDTVVDEDYEEGKMDYKWVLIEVICEEGYSEDIIEAARHAGARGGTVVRGRRQGGESVMTLLGMSNQEEQEFIMIIVGADRRGAVMEAVASSFGLASPAHGVVLSLPVEAAIGLEPQEALE